RGHPQLQPDRLGQHGAVPTPARGTGDLRAARGRCSPVTSLLHQRTGDRGNPGTTDPAGKGVRFWARPAASRALPPGDKHGWPIYSAPSSLVCLAGWLPAVPGADSADSAAAAVFQICLKNTQFGLDAQSAWPILELTGARHLPPSAPPAKVPWTAYLDLLLMVLTRIHPPESGFFLPALCRKRERSPDAIRATPCLQATLASGNRRLKLSEVCSARVS